MNSLQLIQKLKKGNQSPNNFLKVENIGDVKFYLRPVRTDIENASIMAKWRSNVFQSFFTWVKPNENDVLKWLKGYENENKDILFIIEIKLGVPIGQVALYNIDPHKREGEFGRVIRGEKTGPKGIMTFAALALLRWVFDTLELNKVFLHSFADNTSAISLYKRLGFKIQNTCFFKKTLTQKGIVRWVAVKEKTKDFKCSSYEYRKVYKMVLSKDTFNSIEKTNFIIDEAPN